MIKFVRFARRDGKAFWVNPAYVTAVTEDIDGCALIWLLDEKTSLKVTLGAPDVIADLEEGSDT